MVISHCLYNEDDVGFERPQRRKVGWQCDSGEIAIAVGVLTEVMIKVRIYTCTWVTNHFHFYI